METPPPPMNLEAEDHVLGAMMMMSSEAVAAVGEIVSAADFYRETSGVVYQAALDLHAKGDPVDWITLCDELERRGELEEIGSVRINELAALVPTTANAAHYARIVREHAVRRDQLRVLGEAEQAVRNGRISQDDRTRLAGLLRPADAEHVERHPWLGRTSDLLGEPDPGPTPWLVDDLIVDQAVAAVVGKWKTTKTYALLDIAISVATGAPFLDRLAVPAPGPVIVVLEESGRAALWRRLDRLSRGRAVDRDALADLHFAANERVKLDDPGWQNDLLDAGREIKPRLFVFDPLARMKAPGRDESAQKEYAIVIEFLRHLRDETGAAVAFVQHVGHQGEHMRGTSDLEAVWESRLSFDRDGPKITVKSEHREADTSPTISYRIVWDEPTRTIRLAEIDLPLPAKVARYRADHPDATANEVHEEIGGRRQDVLDEVKRQRQEGGSHPPEPPGTTPAEHPHGGGSPDPLSPHRGEGSGTTRRSAGTKNPEPPPKTSTMPNPPQRASVDGSAPPQDDAREEQA